MRIHAGRKQRHLGLAAGLVAWAGLFLFHPAVSHASGSNPYWDSYGNCNSWIPHGWSQTWWNSFPSNSFGSVDQAQLQWYNTSTGNWVVEKYSSGFASGSTNTATADNYWGVTARGSWQEVAHHSGSMSPLTSTQVSSKSIWCG